MHNKLLWWVHSGPCNPVTFVSTPDGTRNEHIAARIRQCVKTKASYCYLLFTEKIRQLLIIIIVMVTQEMLFHQVPGEMLWVQLVALRSHG